MIWRLPKLLASGQLRPLSKNEAPLSLQDAMACSLPSRSVPVQLRLAGQARKFGKVSADLIDFIDPLEPQASSPR